MTTVRTILFARAPEQGRCKTRLIPALGPEGSARLATAMLKQTLEEARKARLGPVELCVTPGAGTPAWKAISWPPGVECSDQGTGDLGLRLARAAQRTIEQGEAVLLAGTDCPDLTVARIREAASALEHADTTLIPALDGGYVLLGLNRFDPSLFEGLPWGGSSVAEETVARIHDLRWSCEIHPALSDIDTPDDLTRLRVRSCC